MFHNFENLEAPPETVHFFQIVDLCGRGCGSTAVVRSPEILSQDLSHKAGEH